MKTFATKLLLLVLLFAGAEAVMATNFTTPENVEVGFASFAVFAAFIPLLFEAIKRIARISEKTPNLVVQLLSWATGIALAFIGWFFELGIFADLQWQYALLYGLGGSLAANGIADTKMIQWAFDIIFSKKNVQG